MSRPETISVEVDRHNGSVPQWEDALSGRVHGQASLALQDQETKRCIPTGSRFSGRLDYGELGDGIVYKCATTPHQYIRSLCTASPRISTPLLLVVLLKGSYRLRRQDRIYPLGPGHWCLIDTLDPLEYWTVSETSEHLAMTVCRPAEPELGGLADQVSGRPLAGGTSLSRIMRSTLTETFEEMNRISGAGAKRLHNTLVAMAWDAAREQLEERSPLRVRNMHLAQLKAYIESHLANPGLSVESIAHACRMSPRSVHRAFAGDPSGSLSRYIWVRRISRCAAALQDTREAHRSITEICYSWGQQHFTLQSFIHKPFRDLPSRLPRNPR
jgi:AraC family transcriptional regulator, positive regulator of tynA and feaB